MILSRSRMILAGLAALALAVAPATAASAAPAAGTVPTSAVTMTNVVAPAPAPVNYVALGDSYAAGYGITPLTDQPVPGCLQAQQNYPHQLAQALGLTLTDATCTGATTANVIGTPQPMASGPAAAPQSDALSSKTNIVTLTIGGNDLGFTSIIQACAALTANGPTVATAGDAHPALNCKSQFDAGGTDLLAAKIVTVVAPAVADTLKTIREKAPNAKIFVVGYPAIAPEPAPATGCFVPLLNNSGFIANSFPFTDVDVPYLHDVEQTLDAAIQAETLHAGATFVPLFDQTQQHTPCAGNPNSFINGITLSATGPGTPIPVGTSTFYLTPGAVHPNPAGVLFMEQQAQAAILKAMGKAPAFTSAAPPNAVAGSSYAFRVAASGFPTPTFAVTGGTLPAGLTLDPATGMISGTPTARGTSTFTVTAKNLEGTTVSPTYTVTVGTPPAITSSTPPAATLGRAYTFRLTASGFPAPTFAVTSGALPKGLILDAATGVISGTPTASGAFAVTVRADNGVQPAATAHYTLTVAAASTLPPTTPPATGGNGAGSAITGPSVNTSGTTAGNSTAALSGADLLLPSGVLSALLLLSGTALLVAVRRRAARR